MPKITTLAGRGVPFSEFRSGSPSVPSELPRIRRLNEWPCLFLAMLMQRQHTAKSLQRPGIEIVLCGPGFWHKIRIS